MKEGILSAIPPPLLWMNLGCRDQIFKIPGLSRPLRWC